MNLSTLAPGALFKVIKVLWNKEVGRRLADMGFTEGAEGQVVRSGFLRGPFQVQIRGYDLLIRRCEAAGIEVEHTCEAEIPIGGASSFFNGLMFRRGLGPGCEDIDIPQRRPSASGRGRGRAGGRGSAGASRGGRGRGRGLDRNRGG